MKYKFEYNTEAERNSLIEEHSDKYLIEEQNIAEGNFLIFADEKPVTLEEKINQLEQQIQNDNIILFDVLATIHEEQLMRGSE